MKHMADENVWKNVQGFFGSITVFFEVPIYLFENRWQNVANDRAHVESEETRDGREVFVGHEIRLIHPGNV